MRRAGCSGASTGRKVGRKVLPSPAGKRAKQRRGIKGRRGRQRKGRAQRETVLLHSLTGTGGEAAGHGEQAGAEGKGE